MKFEAAKMFKYQLSAQADGSPVWVPFDWLGDDTKRAALRAIAEHLGPEETIAALGTDVIEPGQTIGDTECPACQSALEILSGDPPGTVFAASSGSAWIEETRDAIRAAGYDPDEVGAAEVIEMLSTTLTDVERAYMRASNDTATARAQLREWRETVGPVVDSLDQLDKPTARRTEQLRYKLVHALRQRAPRIRRLLSVTPDEGGSKGSWDGRDYLYVETGCPHCSATISIRNTGDREDPIEIELLAIPDATPLDARAAETEIENTRAQLETARKTMSAAVRRAESAENDARTARQANATEVLRRERAEARVGELERGTVALIDGKEATANDVLEEWRETCAELECERRANVEQSRRFELLYDRATRAETAVEAMRGVVEGAEGVAHCGPRTPDETWGPLQLLLVQAAILHGPAALAALADYDANKPEPTDEQPPTRAGGKLEPLELRCSTVPDDTLRLSAPHHPEVRPEVRVQVTEGDTVSVYLDRESVRRAVDWMTAWLGGTQ